MPGETNFCWPTKSSRLAGLYAARERRDVVEPASCRLAEEVGHAESMLSTAGGAALSRRRARPATVPRVAAVSLRDEVTGLLRELVRLDTVNPPGNETRAAELLRDFLEPRGIECRLLARVPERANLVARIPGRDPDAPRLLLLSHTDTVLANPEEWSVDPWCGALQDDHVWGRGALDMKGQVAGSAVALATLAGEGFEPEGDVIFAATADEEVGDDYGLSWLCKEHPEAVRAAWCINEGGGDRIEVGGRVLYLCATSEKASSPFRIRVHGKSWSRLDARHR